MKDDLIQVSTRVLLPGVLIFSLACAGSTPRGASTVEAARDESAPMGTGCDDLVVITAANTSAGIAAEYAWIKEHFPGYRREGQHLIVCDEKMVDVIETVGPDGESREIYFDISSFFGKF